MNKLRVLYLGISVLLMNFAFLSCAGKVKPLDQFSDHQEAKITEKTVYREADFEFWAAVYQPTPEDIEALRSAWIQHGQAFPESKAFSELEKEVGKNPGRTVLLSLFMTSYENADPKDKSLGWTISPVPEKITELTESDQVLRKLMPVKNIWARYFLLRFPSEIFPGGEPIVISNPRGRAELRILKK